jgi:DNA-binding NtrC family response regulator
MNIFIIEDEKTVRVSLADDLKDAGYNVKEFENPCCALEAIERSDVDVVITDIRLPQMDGIELLSRIKTIKPGTQVIVMTAYRSENIISDTREKGALTCLIKPFNSIEILEILDRIKVQMFTK